MGFLRFWWAAIRETFSWSLNKAQLVLFLLFLTVGAYVRFAPAEFRGSGVDLLSAVADWRTAVTILISLFAARLVWAPYTLWQREQSRADSAQRRATSAERKAAIAERRGANAAALLPPETIVLKPGPSISFDCRTGRTFRVTLDRPASLLLPQNPIEGVYRLYIVQGPQARGILAVQAKYQWRFAEWSDFTEPGDLTIYEIDILKVADGFAYAGRPIFQSKKDPPVLEIDKAALTPDPPASVSSGDAPPLEVLGRGAHRVKLEPIGARPTGRLRFRVHFHHAVEEVLDEAVVVFRLTGLTTSGEKAPFVTVIASAGTPRQLHTSPWSAISEAWAGGNLPLHIDRMVGRSVDSFAGTIKIERLELQGPPMTS